MKLYWDYHGRISRKQFWLGFLLIVLIQLPFYFLFYYAFSTTPTYRFADALGNFETIMTLIFLWPSFCLVTKRFHDCDMSGWWCLLNLIPYVGVFITLFIQGFIRGTEGSNRFGDSPLEARTQTTATFYGKEISRSTARGY